MSSILFQFFSFIIPLVLTFLIEYISFLGYNFLTKGFFNESYLILSILAINVLTNPLLNFILFLFKDSSYYVLILLFLEVIVVLTEAVILFKIHNSTFKKWLMLSLVMNVSSYSLGVILHMFGLI